MTALYHQTPLFSSNIKCKDCCIEKSSDEFYKGCPRCKVCEIARREEVALQRALNPEPILIKSKTCNECRIEKPLDEFYEVKAGRYGRAGRCKACYVAKAMEDYQPHPRPDRLTANGKICTKCGAEKPLDDFNGSKIGKTIAVCRACRTEGTMQWRRKSGVKPKYPDLPPAINGGKVCMKCFAEKSLEDFTVDKRVNGGYLSTCRKCQNAYNRTYYTTYENKDQVLAKNQAWYENNKERHAALTKAWRQENHLKNNQYSRKRATHKKALTVETVDYERILERDGYWCYICECNILPGQKFEFDHVIPIDRDGPHIESNIRVTHGVCNRRKHNKLLSEMTPHQRRGA